MPLATVQEGEVAGNGRHQKLVRSATVNTTVKNTNSSSQQQSLGELIICAICLEQLKRPTMLPCQHTFCLLCLQGCIKPNSPLITCPSCRIEVIVPREGVGALPTNIVLQAFLESIKSGAAGSPTSSIRRAQQDPAQTVTDTSKKGSCFKCSEPPLSDPCRHCYQFFCKGCHLAHVADMKTQWTQKAGELTAEDQRLSLLKEESKERSKKLAENIQAAIGIRVQQLCDKQSQLLAELEIWRNAEANRLSDIQQLMSDVLASGSKDDADVEELFNRAGKILGEARLCSTSASAGRITFDEEELALTRQEQMAPLEETPPSAGPADEDPSPLEKVEIRRRVAPHPPLTRRVTFDGTFSGSRSSMEAVTTSLGDRKPLPTPLPETADEQAFVYRSKSGSPKQRLSNIQRPAGIAASPWTPTELYVVSTDSHRVYVVDRTSGRILKSLGSPYRSGEDGSVTGTFLSPFGIAISVVSEEIYVTDKWLNCIQVFNREGTHVRQIGTKGSSPGHFRSPEGIACDSRTGLIYVADTCNDRIQILDRNGAYLRELGMLSHVTLPGGKLHTKREFNEPTGVTVSPDGTRVAVCDSGNCRVKVFNALSGERLIVFGNRGTQRGQFQQPESIAIDDKGFVLVGDNGNGRIQIFRQNGNFVRSLGSKGTGHGQFSWISGLIVTRDMEIIASDFKAHAVQVF